jgi:hypothetical protein
MGALVSIPLTRFHVRALPDESTIIASLAEGTDFRDLCARVKPKRPGRTLISCRLPDSLFEGLRAAADEAIQRHGLHGWLRENGRNNDDSPSLSLSHNPDLDEQGIADVHQSSLGSLRLPPAWPLTGVQMGRLAKRKNTFFDTYGFRAPTPAARIGALGEFLSACRLSPVRSRLAVLRGKGGANFPFASGWHCDEPVFENLRINIPLRSHRSFLLQIEHQRERPHTRSRTMTEHYLAPGRAYTWDTRRQHRVFPTAVCETERVHLVLGFSPWFRYDAGADAWEPNEFYGRVHPFDILRSGALHPALRAQ